MSLRSVAQEIESYVTVGLEMLSYGLPVEEIGRTCDDLCQHYRTLACCALLVQADTDGFLHCLHRSGNVRLHFLQRCAAREGYHDSYTCTGSSAGFFDAMAARNFPLALRIAQLSPEHWQEGEEYRDDFCFAYFFHLAVRNSADDRPRMASTLDDMAQIVQGEESPKLAVCRALLDRHQQAFDEAFEALLDARKEEIEEERPQFFPDDRIVFRTKSRVYTEGLAVLNVADHLGLQTAPEYRYCPVTARLAMSAPFPEFTIR